MNPQREVRACAAGEWHSYREDLAGLEFERLNDRVLLLGVLTQVCQRLDDTSSTLLERQFQPQGVSAVFVGAQLRLVLHTWPELGIATLDVSGVSDVAAALFSECRMALRRPKLSLDASRGESTTCLNASAS